MEDLLELIRPLMLAYGGDFGKLTQIISIIGSLRLINKPLFEFLRAITKFTYWTDRDDKLLSKIETSKIYKTIVFILDWLTSIKLKKDEK